MAMLKKQERGAAMVEFAIAIWVFFMLVFGIIEFGYAIFQWSRVVDATRAGVRAAVVSDLPCGSMDTVINSCPPTNGPPLTCTGGDLMNGSEEKPILARMNDLMRQTGGSFDPSWVKVTYRCSSAGFPGRDVPIPEVTVESTWEHTFFFPGLVFGRDAWTVKLPPFAATRLGEDLYTPSSEE